MGGGMNKKLAAVVLIVAPFVAYFEGFSPTTYWDAHGKVDTICYGHTETAKEIRVRSKEECTALLLKELEGFAHQVDKLVIPEVHSNTLASLTSFSYNVGIGTFKKSSVLKRINNGDIRGGCEYLTKYVYAGGKKLNGLVKRRSQERDLCLSY